MGSFDDNTCIYCNKLRTFTDEHIFPAGLGGDDRNFLLKNLVCDFCNSYFAKNLELTFMRSSEAALSRIFHQPAARTRKKTTNPPKINTKSSIVINKEGEIVEVEIGALGHPILLPQLLFLPNSRAKFTAENSGILEEFIIELKKIFSDSLLIVHKIKDGNKFKYLVHKYCFKKSEYLFESKELLESPPSNCIWLERLEEPKEGISKNYDKLFQKTSKQLVFRAHSNSEITTLLNKARKASTESHNETPTHSHIENPLVQINFNLDNSTLDKVYAKIGLNLIAHAFGADYIRHFAFNKIKEDILNLKSTNAVNAFPSEGDFFNGVPIDRHAVMIAYQKGRAGRFNVAVAIKLYGSKTSLVALSKNAIKPPKDQAILVIDYKNHKIEEFEDLSIFVKTYPPKIPNNQRDELLHSLFLEHFNKK